MLRSLQFVFQIGSAGLQFEQLAVTMLELIEPCLTLPELILQSMHIHLYLPAISLQSIITACLKVDNADGKYCQR